MRQNRKTLFRLSTRRMLAEVVQDIGGALFFALMIVLAIMWAIETYQQGG